MSCLWLAGQDHKFGLCMVTLIVTYKTTHVTHTVCFWITHLKHLEFYSTQLSTIQLVLRSFKTYYCSAASKITSLTPGFQISSPIFLKSKPLYFWNHTKDLNISTKHTTGNQKEVFLCLSLWMDIPALKKLPFPSHKLCYIDYSKNDSVPHRHIVFVILYAHIFCNFQKISFMFFAGLSCCEVLF